MKKLPPRTIPTQTHQDRLKDRGYRFASCSTHFCLMAGAAIACAFLLFGCGQKQPDRIVPDKLPIISTSGIYPEGREHQEFWADLRQFYAYQSEREALGLIPSEELEVMRRMLDLEYVRRATEARVRAYNTWARQRNEENGY